jgi:hypothetical protein
VRRGCCARAVRYGRGCAAERARREVGLLVADREEEAGRKGCKTHRRGEEGEAVGGEIDGVSMRAPAGLTQGK